jgi:hypothetical protein
VLSLPVLHTVVLGLNCHCAVIQLLVIGVPRSTKLNGYLIIEASHEFLLPLPISVHIFRCITSQLVEELSIVRQGARSLAQVAKLAPLQSNDSRSNMSSAEGILKLIPSDGCDVRVGDLVVVPPFSCGSFKLMCGEPHLLFPMCLNGVQFLVNCTQPVISYDWLRRT